MMMMMLMLMLEMMNQQLMKISKNTHTQTKHQKTSRKALSLSKEH